MKRVEAMVTIERYGGSIRCSACGHKVPSIACESGEDCPLLKEYEGMEAHDDVAAIAAAIIADQLPE